MTDIKTYLDPAAEKMELAVDYLKNPSPTSAQAKPMPRFSTASAWNITAVLCP